jgi:hypothetical protein
MQDGDGACSSRKSHIEVRLLGQGGGQRFRVYGAEFGCYLEGISLKRNAQALPGVIKHLRQGTRFGEDGEEVVVARPAWDGVEVQVFGDAGTCGFAEVEAKVEAVGVVDGADGAFRTAAQTEDVFGDVQREGGERVLVEVRDGHEMTAVIGEGVEDEVGVRAAFEDPDGGFGLVTGCSMGDGVVDGGDLVAEDAAEVAGPGGERIGHTGALTAAVAGDVGVTPRCPEPLTCFRVLFGRVFARSHLRSIGLK